MDLSRLCPLCDSVRPNVHALIVHVRVDHRNGGAADAILFREMRVNEEVQAFSRAVGEWKGKFDAGNGDH
jgi:hypothetical protein